MPVSAIGREEQPPGNNWAVSPVNARIPRESNEIVPLAVTLNGRPTTAGLMTAVAPLGQRPRSWRPAELDAGRPGIRPRGLAPGVYRCFIRTPTGTVLEAGLLRIT